MRISDIKVGGSLGYERLYKNVGDVEKKPIQTQKTDKVDKTTEAWQKDILLNALDLLENNVQMDNNHPLSSPMNSPIESYNEAIIELNYYKNNIQKDALFSAQANVRNTDVAALFSEA